MEEYKNIIAKQLAIKFFSRLVKDNPRCFKGDSYGL